MSLGSDSVRKALVWSSDTNAATLGSNPHLRDPASFPHGFPASRKHETLAEIVGALPHTLGVGEL